MRHCATQIPKFLQLSICRKLKCLFDGVLRTLIVDRTIFSCLPWCPHKAQLPHPNDLKKSFLFSCSSVLWAKCLKFKSLDPSMGGFFYTKDASDFSCFSFSVNFKRLENGVGQTIIYLFFSLGLLGLNLSFHVAAWFNIFLVIDLLKLDFRHLVSNSLRLYRYSWSSSFSLRIRTASPNTMDL